MGHEQASTTLNRYTHAPDDYAARVLPAFEDLLRTAAFGRKAPPGSTFDEDGDDL